MNQGATTIKHISQARAKFAWQIAKKRENDKEFASLVKKIPAYIKTNGLLNTIAFLFSKSENKENNREGFVLKSIREWLTHAEYGLINASLNDNKKFIDFLSNKAQPSELIQFTTETLNLFYWLTRFVKSD